MPFFVASFAAVAVTAAQDLFEIVAPAGSRVRIKEIRFGQYSDAGDAAAELLSVLIKRGHTTSGSGGAAVTPVNLSGISGAAAPAATVERNNTTQAADGSPATLLADVWNVMAPYLWMAEDGTPSLLGATGGRAPLVIEPGQRLVISMSAPADSLTMNGMVIFEETGLSAPA